MKIVTSQKVVNGRLQVQIDLQTKGDLPGHPFRGNQWTGGRSGSGQGSRTEVDRDSARSRTSDGKEMNDLDKKLISGRKLESPPDIDIDRALSAVEKYTDSHGFMSMNNSLRERKNVQEAEPQPLVSDLQKLAQQELPEGGVIVYRGIPASLVSTMPDAGEVQMFGFVSTTLDPEISTNFTFDDGAVMEIRAKRGLYVRDHSQYEDEMELIQPHGTRYKVIGKEKRKIGGRENMTVFIMEEV